MNASTTLQLRIWILTVLLIVAHLPTRAARAQNDDAMPVDAQHAQFEACAELDETALRSELNTIAQQIFASDANGIDLDALIDRQWDVLELDALVDRVIDDAVVQAGQDEELLDKMLSGWSPARAEDLTRTVAERAFGSETFRQAIDQLAAGVAVEIEAEIELLTAESVSINLLCLRQFIDRHYSDAIVSAFAADLRQRAGAAELVENGGINNGMLAVIDLHKTALGGVGVIVASQLARRIAVRIAQRVSQRVTGRITARVLGRVGTELIPIVGWVVGTGLIVYDVIDSLDGALPQIEEALKDEEVKATIRAEIGAAVGPELRQELPLLAREIADDLYAEWLDFQRKYRQVLTLAEENPAFNDLLTETDDLAAAAELVDAALSAAGRNALEAALADGTFAQVLNLPPVAADLLADTGSFETVLTWAALAGEELGAVMAAELHKHQRPGELDRDLLDSLLALDDPAMLTKLALLAPDELRSLLMISSAGLRELAAGLTADELRQLAAYVPVLDQTARNRLISTITADPGAMAVIGRPEVRAYLASGRDAATAIAFLRGPADLMGFANDVLRLATNQVSTGLFAAKYGWPLTATGIALPVLLALALVGLILRPFLSLIGYVRRKS
jgi:hypothetical protein